MRIFLAGATGVLGRRLIPAFRAHGHSVVGLARDEKKAKLVESLGGKGAVANIFDMDDLARTAEGADIVIHAATAIPKKQRPRASDIAMNDKIRRDGTRALAGCTAKIGAKHYIQQSIIWVARPADGSPFDEDSPPSLHPLTQSALDGEALAHEAGERAGFSVAVLRCGWFYGAESHQTRSFGKALLQRRMPIVGRGDAVWSLVHLDDAASAFVTSAQTPLSGVWHVVDNLQVTAADFLNRFAQGLGAPHPRHMPVWIARPLAGRMALNFLTSSVRTSNARFRQDFEWTLQFPSFREGLDQIVAAWQEEGFPPKKR